MTTPYTGDENGNYYTGTLNDNNNIRGEGGNDTLTGGSLADTIEGGLGYDRLYGGDGADYIAVGIGHDNEFVDGGAGDDTITAGYFDYVKQATLNGGGGDDIIYSTYQAGSTTTVDAGTGDDGIYVFAGADTINGGAGEDTLLFNAGYTTAAIGVNLLTGTGTAGDAAGDRYVRIENVAGSGYADTITGNGAFNELSGFAGNDSIAGGSGGDYLDGGDGIDTLSYMTSNGAVVVRLATGIGAGAHAEEDQFFNFENVSGSAYNDIVLGDVAANTLWGFGGNDNLSGGAANDTLHGGDGLDSLTGGAGGDVLNGGAGADRFIFTTLADSTIAAATRDTIGDFNRTQADRIDLAGVDANSGATNDQAFTFIGAGAFTGISGQLHAVAAGTNTRIEGDINGDKVADFAVLVGGSVAFVAADFVL